jgi:YcxB-like protein
VATSTVDLSFRYLKSDVVRGLRAHYRSRLRLWLDTVVIIGSAIAGICLWPSPDLHWLGLFFIAVSSFVVLLLLAAFVVIPQLVFRFESKFRDEYSFSFSPEGVHFQTAHIDSHLKWSGYSRALVDAHSYLLYRGSRTFTIIPTRVFQSAEQRRAFEQLLAGHVSEIVGKA